jgi:hypothetical protein
MTEGFHHRAIDAKTWAVFNGANGSLRLELGPKEYAEFEELERELARRGFLLRRSSAAYPSPSYCGMRVVKSVRAGMVVRQD